MGRMLLEMNVKAALVRSQTEIRIMLLESELKIVYYKVKKNLAKLWSAARWCKVGLVSDQYGYLAQEILKKNVESVAWFLFSAYNKL